MGVTGSANPTCHNASSALIKMQNPQPECTAADIRRIEHGAARRTIAAASLQHRGQVARIDQPAHARERGRESGLRRAGAPPLGIR